MEDLTDIPDQETLMASDNVMDEDSFQDFQALQACPEAAR